MEWPFALAAIGVGVLMIVFRRRYAAEITATNRWFTTRLPRWMTRNQEAMTRTVIVMVGLGLVAMPVAALVRVPPWILVVALFAATAIALAVTYLRPT